MLIVCMLTEYHAYNTNKGDNLTHDQAMKKKGLIPSSRLSQPQTQLFHHLLLSLGILHWDWGQSLQVNQP